MTRPRDEGRCDICGEPMPPGEDMFRVHGYSGPCPKPPLPKSAPIASASDCARQLVVERERAERAEAALLSVTSQREHATTMLAAWEQVWDGIRENHVPSLREDNKPLAVAASYEIAIRDRDSLRALLREAKTAIIESLTMCRDLSKSLPRRADVDLVMVARTLAKIEHACARIDAVLGKGKP